MSGTREIQQQFQGAAVRTNFTVISKILEHEWARVSSGNSGSWTVSRMNDTDIVQQVVVNILIVQEKGGFCLVQIG